MPRDLRCVAGVAAAFALLGGCIAGPAEPTLSNDAPVISRSPAPAVDRPRLPASQAEVPGLVDGLPGAGLSGYLAQTLAWRDCGQGSQCASVLAPLDYADPSANAVTLSLRRTPATKTPRLGSLFVNPGGPGAAGTDLAVTFANTGLEQYDIVGWDPRGTGSSTPVQCGSDAKADAFNELDFSPDDDAERAVLVEATYRFGQSCWEHSGVLLEHISTVDTVHDLDLLRQLVGDQRLNFFGYSYGTRIGATYAEIFGEHTGRLVLDAAVDITEDQEVIQAMGFDLALGNFAAWCVKSGCALGSTKDAVLDTVTALFDRLDSAPLRVDQRRLTQSLAVTGVAAILYGGRTAWPSLSGAVLSARDGDGEDLLAAADLLNARDENGHYGSMFFAFPAISCVDDNTELGVLDADRLWRDDMAKAPIFGSYFGPQYTCSLWPVPPVEALQIDGETAAPLLVIGGTGDNATPYQHAVRMAEQLTSATLLTYVGEGHGSYGGKSRCVDRVVVDYLVTGALPESGTRCT